MSKEKTLHELSKEFPDKTYRELEIYREKDRQEEAGACIMGEMRKDRTPLANMKKRAEEAEGELSIMKGIETNRVKEAQDALANALEVNESHQKLNGKLQERLTELEEEHKKLQDHLNKRIYGA